MNGIPPGHCGEETMTRLAEEIFLAGLGIDPAVLSAARLQAQREGAPLETVLICAAIVPEERLYRAMAGHLGLSYLDELPVEQMKDTEGLDLLLKLPHSVRLQDRHSAARTAVVPQLSRLHFLQGWLRACPDLARRIVVTTPSAMRKAVWQRGAQRRLLDGSEGLFASMPRYSARTTLTGSQGFWFGAALSLLMALLFVAGSATSVFLHVAISNVYIGALVFRLVAFVDHRDAAETPDPEGVPGPLPVYTVLVALYREAEVVPQLIGALGRLDWPKSRLDVKLVCEASDPDTLEALSREDLPPFMEVVTVPERMPKTKPKALNYALAGARGDFVTIYDAEDRPHPGQLREAYASFCRNGQDLACLQAPLDITNGWAGWLSGLFAADYAIHFRRVLPYLAFHGLPVPLGGTSNHFRLESLRRAGGWDPYNVTEDADLGLRLRRLGYRIGTITRPTREDAPTRGDIWLRQRTRWYKGWLQTFLVSMRDPRSLVQELGLAGVATYLLTTCGMLASALLHPLLFISLAYLAWRFFMPGAEPFTRVELVMMTLDYINLLASYGLFVIAGFAFLRRGKWRFGLRHSVMIPVYWIMLSMAAWLALNELYRNPHFWAKTPHRPSSGDQDPAASSPHG